MPKITKEEKEIKIICCTLLVFKVGAYKVDQTDKDNRFYVTGAWVGIF